MRFWKRFSNGVDREILLYMEGPKLRKNFLYYKEPFNDGFKNFFEMFN